MSKPRTVCVLVQSVASKLYRHINHTLSLVHTRQLRVNGRVICDRSISRSSTAAAVTADISRQCSIESIGKREFGAT